MKIDRFTAALFLLAALALPAAAQTRPATQPAQQPSAGGSDMKIAFIYSEAFQDAKTGIARFTSLANSLNREFSPRKTELDGLQQRAQQLSDDIDKTRSVAAPQEIQKKMDQLEQMKKDLQRKSEDAQTALEKRQQEVFAPLEKDINDALQAYAKSHGITVIIDRSRVPLVYAADSMDITRAFISEFNSKFPATASAATP